MLVRGKVEEDAFSDLELHSEGHLQAVATVNQGHESPKPPVDCETESNWSSMQQRL